LLALLFALPNVFGEDPALQVERKDHSPVTQDAARAVESFLGERRVHFARSYIDGGRLMVRFGGVADQLAARDAVNERFADTYRTALSFAPRTPELLRAVGLRPMPLGLDLRSEEHTSELQSPDHLVCRRLLEKEKYACCTV